MSLTESPVHFWHL